MRPQSWQAPPFKLLLHLEWILLGIAAIAALSPLSILLRARAVRALPMGGDRLEQLRGSLWLVLVCITLLGLLGRRLPLPLPIRAVSESFRPLERLRGPGDRPAFGSPPSPLWPSLYIALGFGISWLAVLSGGQGSRLFPPLLLIVVIRGCLLFPWRGRWVVASVALTSFVTMQYLALQRFRPLGIPLEHLPRPPGARRLPEAVVRSLMINTMVNSAVLFALVLGFVLLLVSALLNEKQSRQQLAQANQQLRRYSLRIEDQAALQERSRIAREIHDSVGHCLTAQSIQLENVALVLSAMTPNPTQASQHLEAARRLGREALQSVRQAVGRLRVHPLQGQSLTQALEKLILEFQQHSSIALTSHIQLRDALPQDVAIVLYRIVQEGLTNLTKHSHATQAQLQLEQDAQGIRLSLADDGDGFDLAQNTTGFGLQSMAERAAAVQGQFRLVSSPGQGCRLELAVPV